MDIFFNEIEMSIVKEGIEENKARKAMYESMYSDVQYFYKYGLIFTYDDNYSGIVVIIDGKKFSNIKKIFMSLKSAKKFREILTKEEIVLLNKNAKKLTSVHSFNWYKKRKNTPYYLAHLGIIEEQRGKGIFREMLEYTFSYVKKYNTEIALETFNPKNVSKYEHFGFEIEKIVESKDKTLKEIRMIKKL